MSTAADRDTALALFDAHRGFAIALARQRLRRTPPWVASREEIEAAALAGLWKAVQGRDWERALSNFTTYAHTAIVREIRDWVLLASGHRRESPANLQRPTTFSEVWADRVNPIEVVENYHPCLSPVDYWPSVRELAELALALLPDLERRTVVLHYWEDLGFREIGRRLQMSKDSAWALHRDALALLRQRLITEEEVPT